jgi:response regulator RpfG family c-di-GMP phosphodiesterase
MYAALLSELQGDFQDEIDLMRWAVPLHDIGKVGIPDAILLKNRALNAEERSVMESHVTIGYDILKDSASPILRAGADIAISHHERWDGSGYPKGLKGRDIPARGRITGLVDVFDALTTARPYKEAWNLDRTVEWIKERSGRDFDPEIVELFINGLDRIREILAEYGEVEDSGSESALT